MSTARIEALKEELFEVRNSWRTMFAQLEAAERVIEELRPDAERYRWLRECGFSQTQIVAQHSGADLDSAIDLEMQLERDQ